MEEIHAKKKNCAKIILKWIGIIMILGLLLLGGFKTNDDTKSYFYQLYRIDGKNYYLTRGWTRYQLWQWDGDEESLYHRFPISVTGSILWVEAQGSFFYMKQNTLCQWNIDTDEETKLFSMKGHSLYAVLDHYILFQREKNIFILADLNTGTIADQLDVGENTMQLMDVSGNQILYVISDGIEEDLVYLYDSETKSATLLNPEDAGREHGPNHIVYGTLAFGKAFYSKGRTMYQVDPGGKDVVAVEVPWEGNIVAMEQYNDAVLCVVQSVGTGWKHRWTYYSITEDVITDEGSD